MIVADVCILILLQHSFFKRLTEDKNSEKFFRVFYDRMKAAQLEIKATVTVNTSDLGNKRRDDNTPDKDTPQRRRGSGSQYFMSHLILFFFTIDIPCFFVFSCSDIHGLMSKYLRSLRYVIKFDILLYEKICRIINKK